MVSESGVRAGTGRVFWMGLPPARAQLFEGGAEGFALAENGDPGESGLEALEHEEFPEGAGVGFGEAPFAVVIGEVEWVGAGPRAAGFLFGEGAHWSLQS
jgi:hypothetical protein